MVGSSTQLVQLAQLIQNNLKSFNGFLNFKFKEIIFEFWKTVKIQQFFEIWIQVNFSEQSQFSFKPVHSSLFSFSYRP
jgi:hypothetical protein